MAKHKAEARNHTRPQILHEISHRVLTRTFTYFTLQGKIANKGKKDHGTCRNAKHPWIKTPQPRESDEP